MEEVKDAFINVAGNSKPGGFSFPGKKKREMPM